MFDSPLWELEFAFILWFVLFVGGLPVVCGVICFIDRTGLSATYMTTSRTIV